MLKELPTLAQLLKKLQQVPYLASKNTYRVAAYFLEMEKEKLELFCATLLQARERLQQCTICCAWKESDRDCMFCANAQRNQQMICVVETWQELLAIEKTGGYTGVYHILGGVISPLEGVGPEDLSIAQLLIRVQQGAKEIILAMNQTPEGEATSSYISSKLAGKEVAISCLARGIPVGSSLEYMDRVTLYKALSERRPF